MNSSNHIGNAAPARALIISTPKSGTYLLGEVLKNLGMSETKMHLFEQGYSDYAGADIHDARVNPHKFQRHVPLTASLMTIPPGHFAVGHLQFTAQCCRATATFRRFFLTRELRCSLVSFMRFVCSTGRFGAPQQAWYSLSDPGQRLVGFLDTFGKAFLDGLFHPMTGWLGFEDVMTLRFEHLTGPTNQALQTIDRIAAHIGARSYNAEDILSASFAADTITKSPQLTRPEQYWSDDAEKRFVALGGLQLNESLGYPRQASWQSRPAA